MRLAALIVLIPFMMGEVYAVNVDSLNDSLESPNPATKVRALRVLAYHYVSQDPVKSFQYINEGLALVQDKADLTAEKANFLTLKGFIYKERGAANRALQFYYEALKIYESLNQEKSVIANTVNIANLMNNEDKDRRAMYERALELSKKVGDKAFMATCYNNIGFVYLNNNLVDTAIVYFNRCLELAEDKPNISNAKTAALLGLADAHILAGDYTKGADYYESAIMENEKSTNTIQKCDILLSRSKYFIELKDYTSATTSLQQCIDLASKHEFNNVLIDAYEGMSTIYELQGKNNLALTFHKKFSSLKDSLENQNNQEIIEIIKLDYANESKLADQHFEIQALKSKNEFEQRKRQTLIYSVSIIFILLLALAISIYLRQKAKIANEKQILENVELLNAQKNEIMESRLEVEKLQNENIQAELKYKNLESTKMALHISQRNDVINQVLQSLVALKGIDDNEKINAALHDTIAPFRPDYRYLTMKWAFLIKLKSYMRTFSTDLAPSIRN